MKRATIALTILALVARAPLAGAGPNFPPEAPIAPDPARPWLIPPVDGPIIARFQAPGTDWGPGHRGVDFYAAPETAVRAAASGRVAFAGSVAGVNAVTLEHRGDVATTYTDLAEILVAEGSYVLQGEWIGRSGTPHRGGGEAGIHFGVKVAGRYVDPEDFLGPLDISAAIYLTPLIGGWARDIRGYRAGSHLDEPCRDAAAASDPVEPPSGNVAVVVPGLASRSSDGFKETVFSIAEALGYPARRTYVFSYRGSDAPRLHEPYDRTDTYIGLEAAAGKLATMLVRVADRHPNSAVDLVGYSFGGLVARSTLELMMASWGPGLPRIDHLVTYATPHTGSKLAEIPDELRSGTITGSLLTDAVSEWSRAGHVFPDPKSAAVADLRPDSAPMRELARHDVVYGTRVLSLSAANDWIVPPSRATYEGETSNVVRVSGLSGHGAILSSSAARDVVHAFLRDSVAACPTALDALGPTASLVVDFAHDHAADAYGAVEESLVRRVLDGVFPGESTQREGGPLRRGDGR
jgi:Peptidase family M23/Putative serine esterase (DUF676)